MHPNDIEEFYMWLVTSRRYSFTYAGSIVSHIKLLIKYGIPLNEDFVRSLLWHENKYLRRNYVKAVREYNRWLEER